ncbi:hypothetical protein Csa_023713 [Cucumis sativus]|nr:hypothetical protein Csa_023713 [Cucumis sativus]
MMEVLESGLGCLRGKVKKRLFGVGTVTFAVTVIYPIANTTSLIQPLLSRHVSLSFFVSKTHEYYTILYYTILYSQ